MMLIDTRGKQKITKEMKEAARSWASRPWYVIIALRDAPDVQGVRRHDVKDTKQWKARRAEAGKLSSSWESTRKHLQAGDAPQEPRERPIRSLSRRSGTQRPALACETQERPAGCRNGMPRAAEAPAAPSARVLPNTPAPSDRQLPWRLRARTTPQKGPEAFPRTLLLCLPRRPVGAGAGGRAAGPGPAPLPSARHVAFQSPRQPRTRQPAARGAAWGACAVRTVGQRPGPGRRVRARVRESCGCRTLG